MHNVTTRDDVLRQVYRKLTDKSFSDRLTVRAEDGSTPIVATVASDRLDWLLGEISAVGGRANVVARLLDAMLIFAVETEGPVPVAGGSIQADERTLDGACTVGVLMARIFEDGGERQTYAAVGQVTHTQGAALLANS